jgi:hypothetical protein
MRVALQLGALVDIDTIDAVGLGTLLLALGTFWLAFLTRHLLKSAREDRQTALDALKASNRQADAALAAVQVSERQAEIAERSRLDATAPLLGLDVELVGVDLADGRDRFGQVEPLTDHSWPEGRLLQVKLEARVALRLWNWGTSPAHVFFPSLNPDPENLLRKSGGSRYS